MVLSSGPLAQGPKVLSPSAASQHALQASGQVTSFGQPRIAAGDGGAPCSVVPYINGSRRYRIEGALTGNPACQWTCTAGLRIAPGQATQPVVEVTGLFPSDSAGDQQLTVVVNKKDRLTIALTVVSMTDITTMIPATPAVGTAQRAVQEYNDRNDVPPIPPRLDPTFSSTRNSESFPPAFDKTAVLVLLRGRFPDLSLRVRAEPAAAPTTWEAARDPGDTLPEHKEPLLPTLTPKTTGEAGLATNATGSFAVRAYATCGCGRRHTDLTIVLLVVMVQAELVKDRSAASDAGLWNTSRPLGPVRSDHGLGEATFASDPTVNSMNLDADFHLISGGADGRRYISDLDGAIRGYWCNNIVRRKGEAELTGTYSGGQTVRALYAARLNHGARPVNYGPNDIPDDIGGPIWDGTFPCDPPDSVRLANATTQVSANNVPKGLLITGQAGDAPSDGVPLYYPYDNTSTLTKLTVDMRFMAAFYLCSQSAPAVIGIACTIPWRLEAEFLYQPPSNPDEPNAQWAAYPVRTPHTIKFPTLALDPVQPADRANIMVWEPGSVDHMAKHFR
jgi:hypothetical protein